MGHLSHQVFHNRIKRNIKCLKTCIFKKGVVQNVSKYPDVDAFIADFWSKKAQYTVDTEFSKAIYFRERNIIIYDVKKNRFCEHMLREHKSNGIM